MQYRFLTLNSSGEPARAEGWVCASDDEALERAAHHVPSFGAELWRGEHLLSAFAGPLSSSETPEGPARH